MRSFPIRDHDYYGGSIDVEYADDFDDDDFAEGRVRLRWEAYQGGEVSLEVLDADECDRLAAAFTEIAALLRVRSEEIEESGRQFRKKMGWE